MLSAVFEVYCHLEIESPFSPFEDATLPLIEHGKAIRGATIRSIDRQPDHIAGKFGMLAKCSLHRLVELRPLRSAWWRRKEFRLERMLGVVGKSPVRFDTSIGCAFANKAMPLAGDSKP